MKSELFKRIGKLESKHPAAKSAFDFSRLSSIELDILEEIVETYGHEEKGFDGRPSKTLDLNADAMPEPIRAVFEPLWAKVEFVSIEERNRRWMNHD